MSKIRHYKPTVYILTEGETEQYYFGRIKELVNDDLTGKYSVNVEIREIVSGSKTDPKGLVKEAKDAKKQYGYDEVWVVFDKDRDPNDTNRIKAFENAKKGKINIAFSSMAFEHWILLHYSKSNFAFQRSDCNSRGNNPCVCIGTICLCGAINNIITPNEYTKADPKLYEKIKEFDKKAIENAAWLRNNQINNIIPTQLYLSNPYTDVDKLLCLLMGYSTCVYGLINQEVVFLNFVFRINSSVRNNTNLAINLDFTNNGVNSFPFNNVQTFELVDGNEEVYNIFSITNPEIIISDATVNKTITFQNVPINSNNLKFKFSESNSYLLIEL